MGIRSLSAASISTGAKRSKFWDQSAVILSPSYESIATAIATSNTASFTFSSIPQTFKHLQLRVVAKTVDTQAGDFVAYRFNGDSTTSYGLHSQFTATGSGTVSSFYNGAYNYGIAERISSSNSTAFSGCPTTFGAIILDITDYRDSTKRKTIKHIGGYSSNNSYGDLRIQSNYWNNTDAINSIYVAPSGAWNFVTGTKFALYGIKG